MSEANNVFFASGKAFELLKMFGEFIKSIAEKRMMGLEEKIKILKDEAKRDEQKRNELDRKIEKLQEANEKLRKIDVRDPSVIKEMANEMDKVVKSPEAEERGWVNEQGDLTLAGMQEIAIRYAENIIARITEPSIDDMSRNAEERSRPFVCSAELENLIGSDVDDLPFLVGDNNEVYSSLFGKITGNAKEEISSNLNDLRAAQESGRPIQFKGKIFVRNNDKNGYVKDAKNHSQQHNRE